MRSFTSSFSDRRIAAFLLATAVFIVVELLLTVVLPNPAREELQGYRSRVLSIDPGQVQIMGDSAAYYGISCEELTARPDNKGRSFVMQAGPGTGPVFAYFALKEQLARGIRPEAVVYMPSPHTFASSRFAKFVACYATPSEILEAVWHTRELSEATYGLLCRGSYTLRYREEIAAMVRDFDRSALARLKLTGEPKAKSKTPTPSTFGVVAGDAGKPGEETFTVGELPKSTFGKPFSVLPVNDWVTRGLCRLCAENGIPIVWGIIPSPKAVIDSRTPFDFNEAYMEYVSQLPTRSEADGRAPAIELLCRAPALYPDNCFRDPVHLNGYGRTKFTDELATDLFPVLDKVVASTNE